MEKVKPVLKLKNMVKAWGQIIPAVDARGFAERIRANYELAVFRVSAQRMIHVLILDKTPEEKEKPEQVQIVQNYQNMELNVSRQVCLKVAAQIVNRLRSYVEGKAVYQDRVFVEAALRHMGIRSSREFVQMAVRSAQLDALKRELARAAEKARDMQKYDRAEGPRDAREHDRARRGSDRRADTALYESVSERLLLKSIYRKMSGLVYLSGRADEPGKELGILAAVTGFADSMSAARLDHGAAPPGVERMFCTYNPYETYGAYGAGNVQERTEDEDQRLLSAIVLGMAGDCARYGSLIPGRGSGLWLEISGAFQESARMTMERFFFFHRTMRLADMKHQRLLMEAVRDGFEREIRILTRINETADRSGQEEQAEERLKSRNRIALLLREQKKDLSETLKEHGELLMRRAARLEEEIRHYLYYEETRHVTGGQWLFRDSVRIVHVGQETGREYAGTTRAPGTPAGSRERMAMGTAAAYPARRAFQTSVPGQNTREIGRLVGETLAGQMSSLTDRMYGRLKRQLYEEQKRRGF